MLYADFIKTMTDCPFCARKETEIIAKAPEAFLTFALSPYHAHHLLVVPNRHVVRLEELSAAESSSIDTLLQRGAAVLKKLGYDDYTLLVRNGEHVGKSVDHVHYHLIPAVTIGGLDHIGRERTVMEPEEVAKRMNEFRKAAQEA